MGVDGLHNALIISRVQHNTSVPETAPPASCLPCRLDGGSYLLVPPVVEATALKKLHCGGFANRLHFLLLSSARSTQHLPFFPVLPDRSRRP